MLKQLFKFGAHLLNDAVSNRKVDNVHNLAYADTAKQIKAAKRSGKFTNGSKLYKKNREKRIRSINQYHSSVSGFIDSF